MTSYLYGSDNTSTTFPDAIFVDCNPLPCKGVCDNSPYPGDYPLKPYFKGISQLSDIPNRYPYENVWRPANSFYSQNTYKSNKPFPYTNRPGVECPKWSEQYIKYINVLDALKLR